MILSAAIFLTACGDNANTNQNAGDSTTVNDTSTMPLDTAGAMLDSSTSGEDTAQNHLKAPGR